MQAWNPTEQIQRTYAAVIASAGPAFDLHDIDDLVQKLWLKRIQQMGSNDYSWQGRGFRQWIRFRVIDESKRIVKFASYQDSEDDLSNTALSTIISEEMGEMVQQALSQLPPQQREVVKAVYFSGKQSRPRREMAAELGIPHQTLESRLRQALKTLSQNSALQNFWFEK